MSARGDFIGGLLGDWGLRAAHSALPPVENFLSFVVLPKHPMQGGPVLRAFIKVDVHDGGPQRGAPADQAGQEAAHAAASWLAAAGGRSIPAGHSQSSPHFPENHAIALSKVRVFTSRPSTKRGKTLPSLQARVEMVASDRPESSAYRLATIRSRSRVELMKATIAGDIPLVNGSDTAFRAETSRLRAPAYPRNGLAGGPDEKRA